MTRTEDTRVRKRRNGAVSDMGDSTPYLWILWAAGNSDRFAQARLIRKETT